MKYGLLSKWITRAVMTLSLSGGLLMNFWLGLAQAEVHSPFLLEGYESDPSAIVDLSPKFLSKVPSQRGAFCSIHSTAALVEAACFAKTGKRINLSEASLIADHLRFYLKQPYRPEKYLVSDTWIKPNREQLEFSVFSEILNHHHASVLSPNGIALTGFDGAYARQVLTQILIGNVLTEAELATDQGFYERVESWVNHWGPKEAQNNHNDLRLWAVRDLDLMVLGRHQEGGSHFRYQSPSGEMRECLQGARFQVVSGPGQYYIERKKPDGSLIFEKKVVEAPRADDLVAYLDQGLAIHCALNQYVFRFEDQVQVGAHSVVVVGYRRSPEKGLEFRVRDSNFESHQWIQLNGCDEFVVLK